MSKTLQQFKKNREKLSGVTTSSEPPKYWLSSGFYTVNKILSGSYTGAYASGRIAMLTGPSNAGKSLLAISAAVQAQKEGYGVFIVDSENALDDAYMQAVGLDVDDENFFYQGVNSITAAKKVMTDFIQAYRADKDSLPPFVMIVDSLDQLYTDAHVAKSEKGEMQNDQGQQAKLLKQFCSGWAHDIKGLDIFGIATKQPYQNQDPIMSKVKPWIITHSMRFPFSQILLVTNVFLKNDKTKIYDGVKITAFADKTRFCKPFQKCVVEVPYDCDLDPYNGVLEAAASVGVVEKNGGWYTFGEHKFQASSASEHIEEVFNKLVEMDKSNSVILVVPLNDDESEDFELGNKAKTSKKKTKRKNALTDE